MTFDPNRLVYEFMVRFERPVDQDFNVKDLDLCRKLITEEYEEVDDELYQHHGEADLNLEPVTFETHPSSYSKERLTKELCDLIYVSCYTANKFGLPLEEAFKRVHESNLSKLDDNGKPLLREDGKILKSSNYNPANLGDLFA